MTLNILQGATAILAVVVGAQCGATPSCKASSGAASEMTQDCFAPALEKQMPGLLARHRVPGAVVSYIMNGEVAWTRAFGVADVRTRTPMQPDMVFNHGSNGKVMAAWALMRLVEAGKIELDAPVNRYLKRWKIGSQRFDPNGVTPRRLLSHTAGLTARGFADYEPGATLPSLVDVLEGRNQGDGAVSIGWEPGSRIAYSGGGYVVAQMLIEDVSGEPFAAFMDREVARPLGLSSLGWVWTADLERRAPIPYDRGEQRVSYRQLAVHAVGSEIVTVPDFARFVAAAVAGPHDEPPGRGVLRRETIATMLEVAPNARNAGLGYGIAPFEGGKLLTHSGSNPGWFAHFQLSVERREGFVIATNSSLGGEVSESVGGVWSQACLK